MYSLYVWMFTVYICIDIYIYMCFCRLQTQMYVSLCVYKRVWDYPYIQGPEAPSIGEPRAVHRQRGSQRRHGFVLTAILATWRDKDMAISWDTSIYIYVCMHVCMYRSIISEWNKVRNMKLWKVTKQAYHEISLSMGHSWILIPY